jgi:hypothetical protein
MWQMVLLRWLSASQSTPPRLTDSGTSKMPVSEPGVKWSEVELPSTPLHPGLLTVILEVLFATYVHLTPDDGLLMPETCR